MSVPKHEEEKLRMELIDPIADGGSADISIWLKDTHDLYMASYSDNLDATKRVLYTRNVGVNDMEPRCGSALHAAMQGGGGTTTAEFLIMNGADVNQTFHGFSPLFESFFRSQETTQLLIRHKASLEIADPKLSVVNKFAEWIQKLIQRQPPPHTYLLTLLKHGAVVDDKDLHTERTALEKLKDYGFYYGEARLSYEILSHVIKIMDEVVNVKAEVSKELGESIQFLQDNAAIVAINGKRAEDGNTALHLAVATNQEPVVALLLSKNPNLTITNSQGDTALDIAKKQKNDTLIRLIQEADARIKKEIEEIAQKESALLEKTAAKPKQ